MHSMRSGQRQVELRRLDNQLRVFGKANSLCEFGNIIVTNRDINDSETVYFLIQDHYFDRAMYLSVKYFVFCLLQYQVRPLMVEKYQLPLFTLFRLLCPAFSFADVDTYGI